MERNRRDPTFRTSNPRRVRPTIRRQPTAPAPSKAPLGPEHPPAFTTGDSERRFVWLMLVLAVVIATFIGALYNGVDRQLAIAVFIAAIAIWSIVLLWKVPRWQAESRRGTLSEKEVFEVENSARSTLGGLLGSAAVLAGIFFAWQQLGSTSQTFHLSEEGQITDRITRAVDQLGNDEMVIRLGGIYALERIARDSRRDAGPVMDVLAAYVRHWSPLPEDSQATPALGSAPSALPADVQAVLEVIGRRDPNGDIARCIDLSHTNLASASLANANLTNLCLVGVDLRGADLGSAKLTGSDLTGANLLDANLAKADLAGTTLTSADISRANLGGADLTGARLDNALLRGTILQGAMLRDVFLNGADLQGAYLFDAMLDGADLLDADLTGAFLTGADLSETRSLTQEQVDRAVGINDETELPPGIKVPDPAATPSGSG